MRFREIFIPQSWNPSGEKTTAQAVVFIGGAVLLMVQVY